MRWCSVRNGFLAVQLLVLIAVGSVSADPYHYVNNLVGNRAAELGGAYTALADDTAGCFYNPAGIAMAAGDSISASMNAYVRSNKKYKDTLRGVDGHMMDYEQEASSLLPNFFGVVKRAGDGWIGLSYAVPDSMEIRQKQSFYNIRSSYSGNPIDHFIININDSDKTYLFGPSYARRITENLSLGVTLYAFYRDKQIIRNQVLQFNQGEHYWLNYYEDQQDWGYRPMLGAVWEPVDKLSIGLTFSKIYVSSSSHEQQTLLRDSTATTPVEINGDSYDFSDTDTLYINSQDSSDRDEYPLRTTLGLAWFYSPRFLLTTDFSYSASVADKEAVLNAALGAEYYLRDDIALRTGLFSDLANTPSLSKTKTNQAEHVDSYGISLSLTYFNRSSSISLGTSYALGSGEAQVVADSTVIQDVEMHTFALFLAASYAF